MFLEPLTFLQIHWHATCVAIPRVVFGAHNQEKIAALVQFLVVNTNEESHAELQNCLSQSVEGARQHNFNHGNKLAAPITRTYDTGDGSDGNSATRLGATPPYTLTATVSTFSYVLFHPGQAFTFAQQSSLSADFVSNSGGSSGGSPRLRVQLDTNHDSVGDGSISIYLGTSPSYADADALLNTFSNFNVIGNNDAGRYDTSAFLGGSPFTTHSAALAMLGNADVLRLGFVMDAFHPLASQNLTLNGIHATAEIGDGAVVPEPGIVALMAIGFGALCARRRKQS